MEHENLDSFKIINILMQWLFFFGMLTVIFLPALLFRNLAVMYNKKGWVYFIVGIGVGIISFNLGHLVIAIFKYVINLEEITRYFGMFVFLPAFLFCWISFKFLKRTFSNQ